MDADGSNQTKLTKDGSNGWPAWSPDGRFIAYVRDNTTPLPYSFLYIMKADGSNAIRLSNRQAGYPAWSPDSKYITFESYDGDNRDGLYIIDIADGADTRIVGQEARMPRWIP